MHTHCSKLVCVLLIGLSACHSPMPEDQDRMIFRYNQSSGISSLDPVYARVQGNIWAVHQLFSTLVELDEALRPVPALARSWEITDSGRTYLFHLRTDVLFHPSAHLSKRELTAEDVAFSLQRLRDDQWASPGAWVMAPVSKIEVKNDSTLEIELTQRFPPFLSTLSMAYASVVSKEAVQKLGAAFGEAPVGTGPFQFQRWLPDEKLVLRKNEAYFLRDAQGVALPYLDAVSIRFLPDKQAEYLELLRGRIDMISGLDPSYIHDLVDDKGELSARHRQKLVMKKGNYLNTEYLGIFQGPVQGSPHCLQDRRLRNAFHAAIDRPSMLQYLRKGMGNPHVSGLIPQGLSGRYESIEKQLYQPDSARKWIGQWQMKNEGQRPAFTIHTPANYRDLCEFIQAQLIAVGFEVQVEIVPASLLREGMAQGKFEVFRASWIADYPDAQNYLSLFVSGNHSPFGPNYTHFNDPQLDALYLKSQGLTEDSLRSELYREMDSLTQWQLPLIPLFYDEALRFHGKEWHGLEPNPLNLLDLSRVYRKEKET